RWSPYVMGSGPGARTDHHLVWRMMVRPQDGSADQAFHAWVDAHTGNIIALFPDVLNVAACQADPRQLQGVVRGGIHPNRADDTEESRVFPFVQVEDGPTGASILKTTDPNGTFSFAGGTALSRLDGAFFKLNCSGCDHQPLATATGAGLIDLGMGGSSGLPGVQVVGNGSTTPADRDAFYHLSQARQLLNKWGVLNFPEIKTKVNIDQQCNASSGQLNLSFFRGSSRCNNTGEIRDVMQHELGHTWDRTDGTEIADLGLSEWKGDLMALLMGGDSCVGESFFKNAGDFVTTACSGVRDLDETAPGRTDVPATPAECSTCATLTAIDAPVSGSCANEVHCVGSIPGQALWHLKQNLLTGVDYITGASLGGGNPALSAEQTEWLLEKLMLAGGPPMETWDPAAPGVNLYDSIMVVDDDDMDLTNGTPHGAYIDAALSHHEIAPASPVGDSPNCASPADPSVTAMVEIDPSTGFPRVRIDWSGGGSPLFNVGRNWRVGDAFLPVATGVAAGPVFDTNVGVGETLNYFVAAVAQDSCGMISPGNNIVTVTVNVPRLDVGISTITEVTGDGDGVVEPGEVAGIDLELAETGGLAGATAVAATLTSLAPEAAVAVGGPVAYGNMPAGGTAMGGGSFTVAVSPDAPCGSSIFLPVAMAADEGCWSGGVSLPVGGATCDVASGGFVRPVAGSLVETVDSGDGDGIADNCEIATYSYAIANVGDADSGAVSASVVSLSPEAPLVSGNSLQLQNLLPGQQTTGFFSVDVGSAKPASSLAFTVTATSTANSAPAGADFVVPAEQEPRVFGTVSYDFESGAQGWTEGGYTLSTARASTAGGQSFHAGSLTQNWRCQHLLSPVLHLDPAGGSMLSFELFVDAEPFDSTNSIWFDRANIHVIDATTGVHSLITPTGGILYNIVPDPGITVQIPGGICHIDLEVGWSDNLAPFGAVQADLSAFAGQDIRLEFNYASDGFANGEGIYVDDVMVTGATETTVDGQSNTCQPAVEVSAPGSPVPLDVVGDSSGLLYTWEDLGPGFTYNLYVGTAGAYFSHAMNPLVCGSTGVTCDGTSCVYTDTVVPPGTRYFLVTGTRAGREGPTGFGTSGQLRDPSQDSCVP
ncbi:MAG: hypothetical protein ACE5ID_02585, partial [Acidobacteriota bacterium]